jgi:hypothetical protein
MKYRDSLEKLGYVLKDHGNHWRTSAVYRNGKTSTSVIIYKNTGVWRDFGIDSTPLPFKVLVEKTLNTKDPKILKQYVSDSAVDTETYQPKEEKIQMEKIYPKSYLEKLLPIRNFYQKKNISTETQELFMCGYAGNGKMYRRIVFPIFNLDNQIHGFSGRTVVEGDNIPKWKHLGRKTDWVYPHHLAHDHIDKQGEVILVESIGDCMALYEAGFKNVLMLAGLDISSKVMSYLNTFNLDKIIVAMNNDKNKETNSGGIASVKTVAKLSQIYDLNVISINPPLLNDFGDMLDGDPPNTDIFSSWYARKDKWNLGDEKTQDWIKSKIENNESLNKNGSCKKLIKILNS